jgi:hypothetical protein
MKNKKAQTGDTVLIIANLFMLVIVALSINAIYAVNFNSYTDTKNIESTLLGNKIYNCLVKQNQIELDNNLENMKISEYCELKGTENSYIYFNLTKKSGTKDVILLEKIENKKLKESIEIYKEFGKVAKEKYFPGEFNLEIPIKIIENENTINGQLNIEVITSHEF